MNVEDKCVCYIGLVLSVQQVSFQFLDVVFESFKFLIVNFI